MLASLLLVALPQFSDAAIITSTATGGDWGTGSTWVGGVAPANADSVVIATTGGNSVTISANKTNAGLTVNSGAILNFSGAFTLTENGNVVNNGTITGATGILKTNTANITIGGSGTIGTSILVTQNFSFASGANLTINNNINSPGKTVTNNGTVTLNGNYARTSGTAIWTQGTNSVLNISGSFTPSANVTLNASASGNTVNYYDASQSIEPATYYNLHLSGSGAKSIVTGTSISNNLSIAPTGSATANIGAGLNISVGTLTTGGLGTINGTWGSTASAATYKDDTYFAATTGILTVATDSRTAQATLVAVATPSTVAYGSTSTLSTTGGSGTGAVTFSAGASTGCSVLGTTLSVTDASGSCSITATKSADRNYLVANSAPLAVTLTKGTQATLTAIVTPSTVTYGSTATLSSSGGSGTGAVSYDAGASTGCSITDTTLNVTDASGSCSVTATKAGDANYNPATSSPVTVTLVKANQTITFNALSDKALSDPDFTVSASSTSGLAVTFSSLTTSVCTISTNTVHLVTTGTCTIRATQTGNTNYNAATPVDQSFSVTQVATKFVIVSATAGTIDLASLVTIEAQKADNSLASSYQQDVTLVTSGSASGGGKVNIVNGVGTTTINDNVVETVHLSLQDTEGTGLDVSSTRDVSFGPGVTASLSLSAGSTTQLVAGTRLPLTVSRQDRLGHAVTAGSESFYLYSDSSSAAKKFYDAASGGNIVSTVLIPDGASSATIWYYDEKTGSPQITASDNSTAPDGTSGVDDAVINLTVTSAPASSLLLNGVSSFVAGQRSAYELSRRDQFGNLSDNSSLTVYLYQYSSSPTTAFYDAASGGSKVSSVTLNSGVATSSFWIYGEKAETFSIAVSDNASAPDGSVGVNDASDNVTINAGPVSTFTLNNPGDVVVGTRAGYVVSRFDTFNNPVTAGETLVYLSHNDTVGTSTEFYDAADSGNIISSIPITDTNSTANFWLYASGVASYNVTVSDATPANGATGIADATDFITVSPVPIVATRLVILDTTPAVVGDTAAITIQAQDASGNVDTSFNGTVTLHTTGSATPGGTVSIVNGVGSINIIDTKAELVNLTLEDTGSTGLDVSSVKTINYLPGPTKQYVLSGNTTASAGERVSYTISRQDQYANAVTAGVEDVYLYSNALPGTASFYNAPSGGSQISSISILNGLSSTNVYFAGTMAGTIVVQASDNASAPDGGDGIVDATSTLKINPGPTARLALNDPGDMYNGTRLGYTATRYDAYNNPVISGGATYYLYSNAHGTSTAFYSSAVGGSPITSLNFVDTQSTANFWYYETENGTWTIYISDNSSTPDGANGVVDGEDGVVVSAIPITARKFIIVVPDTTVLVNTPTTVTIRAVDDNNDIDASFNGSVTLKASGSAIGEGLVTLVNGVGQKVINDTTAETVTLSLQDTEGTGLDVSDTQILVFSQTASVPVGGGGGGPSIISPSISFSGLAFPRADVEIMAIQDGQVPVGTQSSGSASGNFSAKYTGKLPASVKSFALVVYDKNNNIAQTKIFKLGVNDQLSKTLLMSPTIDLRQDQAMLGTFVGITGSAMPGYKIELMIDGVKAPEIATVGSDGQYNLNFNTYRLGLGLHTVKVRQVSGQGNASDYSIEKSFNLIKSFIPKADLNKDGKIDIADWGIFMSRYRLTEDKNRLELDLNGDGKVDVQDLGLLMQAIKQ